MRHEILIGEEVGIARGDDGVGDDEPRRAVVGMEAVPAPGVVGQHDIGTDEAQQPGDLPPGAGVVAELTVGPTEEGDVAPAEKRGGAALLLLAHGDEHRLVLSGVPTSLRTVGQHEVVQDGARRRPLGQRGAAAELDVIGMGADGQGGHGHAQIACAGAPRREGRSPERSGPACRHRSCSQLGDIGRPVHVVGQRGYPQHPHR